jgi:hypothetical protein
VTGGEQVIADFVDGVVQVLDGFGDALPGQVRGLAAGGLQAETDLEQVADDPVEQVLTAMCPCLGGRGPGELGQVVVPRGLGWRPGSRSG